MFIDHPIYDVEQPIHLPFPIIILQMYKEILSVFNLPDSTGTYKTTLCTLPRVFDTHLPLRPPIGLLIAWKPTMNTLLIEYATIYDLTKFQWLLLRI